VLVATRGHIVDSYSLTGSGDLTGAYGWLPLLGTALIGVPALIGAFWGTPLVARELEERTYRVAWTQSVTRTRWLAVKLAVVGTVTAAAMAAFALMFTWWSAPIDAVGNRIGSADFAQRGVVPIGYALFGLALGTSAGVLLRRMLPAMAATLAAFFVVRFVVQRAIRTHLVGVETVRLPFLGSPGARGWVLSSHTVDAAGNTISRARAETLLSAECDITRDTPKVDAALADCAQRIGIHDVARAHTLDQFWTLQAVELGLFIALTGVIIAATFWWLDHRIG
jgi:hypothetical protein